MKATTKKEIIFAGTKPARCNDGVAIVESIGTNGLTTWHKSKVARIQAPMGAGAYDRTIRVHELLHAAKPMPRAMRKYHPRAFNAVEDCYVHSIYWPASMPVSVNRDCLAVACIDARSLSAGDIRDPLAWNTGLLCAVRALAIATGLYNAIPARGRKHQAREAYKHIFTRIGNAYGEDIRAKLENIVQLVRRNKRKQAIDLFTALLLPETGDDEAPEGERPKAPTNRAGAPGRGGRVIEPMRIVRLPMPESSNSTAPRITLARSGAHIYRPRLVRAVLTGSTCGLFRRQKRLAGGSYLFDASGSMGVDAAGLNAICRKVPAALVAYYSGYSGGLVDGSYGELVIYADNGRRAAAADRIYGGNDVDADAIAWLLRQPAPRVYVGDGHFCGGESGQETRALVLLTHAVATGAVRWVKSIRAANDELDKATAKR